MRSTDFFYSKLTDPNKSCFLALRSIILDLDEEIAETMKYGMPCYTFKKKPMCYLWSDKKTKEPYVLFVEGKRMSHPELKTGDRAKMKIFRINPAKDLPLETIQELLSMALDLYKNGIVRT